MHAALVPSDTAVPGLQQLSSGEIAACPAPQAVNRPELSTHYTPYQLPPMSILSDLTGVRRRAARSSASSFKPAVCAARAAGTG